MLATAGNLRPGPAYVWGRLGGRAEYVKIMIDSGNTVGDLVSEEFARRIGLEGDEVRDHIAVPAGSHAPGGGRTRVLAHGLFSANGGLGASAAAAAGRRDGGGAGIAGGGGS